LIIVDLKSDRLRRKPDKFERQPQVLFAHRNSWIFRVEICAGQPLRIVIIIRLENNRQQQQQQQ